ncbi:MAG: LysM peptidoglycan-binding domain-containing protein [Candidatus Erginobacter occultus]|nr:LysM peptidoglycan-binding domain-containing protein [Candidatus Erginobacter occultus]
MSKTRMVFYGALGSLVSVLLWSFIGGCHTSSDPDSAPVPEPQRFEPTAREEPAPPAPISEETLIEEGIITPEKPPIPPVDEPAGEDIAAEPTGGRIHTVEKGDTLWGISRLYGVSVGEIAEANNLADPGRLAVGQRLAIP